MIHLNPGAEGIRSIFVRLRTRSGLNVERLRSTEVNAESLESLPMVQRYIHATGSSSHEAVVKIVTQSAEQLEPTDLVIADAALALGFFTQHPGAQDLYAEDLGLRRIALVKHWAELHELLGVKNPVAPPSVRMLRTTRESQALGKLAELCAVESLLRSASEEPEESVQLPVFRDQNSAVVFGAAVTDLIFVVDRIPGTGQAADVTSFEKHLGGKGLNHAVATARLGIPTRLISAVGDDEEARAIVNFLHKEQVETNLIKIVPFAKTPVTGLVVTRDQGTAALGWKNEKQVRLDPADLRNEALHRSLRSARVVLITCELPVETIRGVLSIVKKLERKPIVILNLSPLPEQPQAFYDHLSLVDYLIGGEHEIRGFLPESAPDTPFDDLAKQLHLLGVEGICEIKAFSCRVRTSQWNRDIPGFPTAMRDAPGTRCVFGAALADRLMKTNNDMQQQDWEWATAAMAATQSVGSVPDAMPTPEKIERILRVSEMSQS